MLCQFSPSVSQCLSSVSVVLLSCLSPSCDIMAPKRRPPVPLPGQSSLSLWLLRNKVEDETDDEVSEPEASVFAEERKPIQAGLSLDSAVCAGISATPPPRVGLPRLPASTSRVPARQAPASATLRRSARIVSSAAAADASPPSPELPSPGETASESEEDNTDPALEDDWCPTREDLAQDSDGSGERLKVIIFTIVSSIPSLFILIRFCYCIVYTLYTFYHHYGTCLSLL